MLNVYGLPETTVASKPRMSIFGFAACLLILSIVLTSACEQSIAPTETPRSSSIYTVPSQPISERDLPVETTEPAGFIGDQGLADVLDPALDSTYQGTVLIWKDGEVVLEDCSGFSDVEREILCSPETTYEIGFITRQFTAVAAMKLFEEGSLDPDAFVSDYIPEYVYADRMTVRMLLSMTSGIPDYLVETIADRKYTEGLLQKGLTTGKSLTAIDGFGSLDPSFETVLANVQEKPLLFEPGTGFAISNTGYVFLAEIIERVSDIPYIHFVQKNILTPAGLDTASFSPSFDTATGYVCKGKMQYLAPDSPLIADGGLRMTANDMLNWMRIVGDRQLLKPETWNMILDPGVNQFGIGFTMLSDGSIVETSDSGGYSSTVAYVPSADLVVIILLNRNSDVRWADPVIEAIFDYYGIDAEKEITEPEESE